MRRQVFALLSFCTCNAEPAISSAEIAGEAVPVPIAKLTPKGSSSIGRVPVSKTGGWGFESLLPCDCGDSDRIHADANWRL